MDVAPSRLLAHQQRSSDCSELILIHDHLNILLAVNKVMLIKIISLYSVYL